MSWFEPKCRILVWIWWNVPFFWQTPVSDRVLSMGAKCELAWPGWRVNRVSGALLYFCVRGYWLLRWFSSCLIGKHPDNPSLHIGGFPITNPGIVRTRRLSDAHHGVPQRGSKKQETWHGPERFYYKLTRQNTKHRYMNTPTDRTCPDPATKQKKMPESLGDGGERNRIEWSSKRSAV